MRVVKYTTDVLNNIYFEESKIESCKKCDSNIIIDTSNLNQKWLGMGGAVTQASCVNYLKLSSKKRKDFINDYYDELNYKWVRLPIGSCDFSPISYEYSNKKYLFPLLNDIKKYKLTYLASPWTPPKMYKVLPFRCGGRLKKKYYDSYVDYLIKYIDAYKDNGINIDYLTIQNEPNASQIWESCIYSFKEQKELIKKLSSKLDKTKIVLWDHNKDNFYNNINDLYFNNKSIAGIGFHWYTGGYFEELKKVRNKYKNLLLIETEMCCGMSAYSEEEWLNKAELYLNEIIGNVNNGMNAYIDWNILLDYTGGPNHVNNYCAAPIILNKKGNDYIKTPIYYYLKHISLVPVNSYSLYRNSDLKVCSFINNKYIYITVLNDTDVDKDINIKIGNKYIKDIIKRHSIITYKMSVK